MINFSSRVHGDIRQYDITDTKNPKLTGQVWLGGCITKEFGVKVTEDQELKVKTMKINFVGGLIVKNL